MKLKETIIKALSLGTGLAIGMLLIAKVCYEMSHDKCYSDYGQIYKIRTLYTQHGDDIEYDNISGAVAPGFRQYVPGVETATRWTFIFNSDRFTDEDKNVIEGESSLWTIASSMCLTLKYLLAIRRKCSRKSHLRWSPSHLQRRWEGYPSVSER